MRSRHRMVTQRSTYYERMELSTALTVWVVVVVVLYVLFYAVGRSWWSSLAIALLTGLVLLLFLFPPNQVRNFTSSNLNIGYGTVIVGTLVVLSWYIIERSLSDVRPGSKNYLFW